MTADSTVAEIEATGGTALGIEVDVRDQEAKAMVARVLRTWPRQEPSPFPLHSERKPSVCAVPCKKKWRWEPSRRQLLTQKSGPGLEG